MKLATSTASPSLNRTLSWEWCRCRPGYSATGYLLLENQSKACWHLDENTIEDFSWFRLFSMRPGKGKCIDVSRYFIVGLDSSYTRARILHQLMQRSANGRVLVSKNVQTIWLVNIKGEPIPAEAGAFGAR
ncbi:hypothetical protein LZ32DRAFT_446958 [Colletotrichum eremochloae]|nr:hypothetical protein LZ32DRAFT_446958 [Colletotrichum eremochloae]